MVWREVAGTMIQSEAGGKALSTKAGSGKGAAIPTSSMRLRDRRLKSCIVVVQSTQIR